VTFESVDQGEVLDPTKPGRVYETGTLQNLTDSFVSSSDGQPVALPGGLEIWVLSDVPEPTMVSLVLLAGLALMIARKQR
jgi:hypothetical protein